MSDKPRRPQAFKVAAREGEPGATVDERPRSSATVTVEIEASIEPDVAAALASEAAVDIGGRGPRWSRLLAAAVGGLLSLAVGLWVDGLIRALFARADWLGWVGVALLAAAGAAIAAIGLREILGAMRLARIDRLRVETEAAAAADDEAESRRLAVALGALYAGRPEAARGRAALAGHLSEIVEGRDLLVLAERELMAPLDAAAQILVTDAAKRVSVVTAISPRAIVDLLFVLVENLRLLRRLADLYGGRPGMLGFLGFAGRVVGHLGVTGGMAIGDTLVQQLVGQGLAARISARLGEGVVNGLLTARIGLAALDLVRPMPFLALPRPSLGAIVSELTRLSGTPAKTP